VRSPESKAVFEKTCHRVRKKEKTKTVGKDNIKPGEQVPLGGGGIEKNEREEKGKRGKKRKPSQRERGATRMRGKSTQEKKVEK